MMLNKGIYIRTILLTASTSIALISCQSESVRPNSNDAAIPSACTSSAYEPIYTLISSRGYNEKRAAYFPIAGKNGFIRDDFNKDGLTDFIFLERKLGASQAVLKTCISNKKQPKNYQARQTKIIFREYKTLENYVESGSVALKNGILDISYGSHAHNDGGQSTGKKYTFDPKLNNFILKEFSYSAYGDAYGDKYYIYDLNKKTYHSELRCTFPNFLGGDISSCKAKTINSCLKEKGEAYRMQLGNGVNKSVLESMIIDC